MGRQPTRRVNSARNLILNAKRKLSGVDDSQKTESVESPSTF